jgi:2-[(L-alanin-3-ylcarbamoyl)methyl]-2-hydroxybutanedioate decarboxylase
MVPERIVEAVTGARRPVCAYVYDTAALRAQAQAVRAALPAGAELLYAVKANGHPGVVAALAAAVDGVEVASGGELDLAVRAGAGTIVFSGPAKTDAELRAAIRADATIHVESGHELRRLAVAQAELQATARAANGRRVSVALRVNRAGAALPGTHQMTGAPTPFGIDEASLPEAVQLAAALPEVDLLGFHLHAVSNNLDAAAHAAFVADALSWALQQATAYGVPLRYLNLGGGFGVDYTGDDRFDLAAFAAAVPAAPPGVRLVFEPGRLLAAEAGWYAAQVLDLKRTHGRWFAVLRGGTHHFRLPAAWRYSHPFAVLPLDEWPYPFERPEVRDVAVDAVGELCTPRDVLTRGQRVDRLRVGDVLVFGRTGAYGWDISHHDFLRHPYPQMITV